MIEIKNLQKSFGSNTVLKNINLTIRDGEIYGLVGRSGAGKSTLLRCINGLENYDSGSMIVGGVDVSTLSPRELREFRRGIGMIFQQFSLLRRMTVYQNIALPMKWWGYSKKEINARVDELVKLVGIEDKLQSKTDELSGGQKQRVAIARALAMSPELLLCDEATSALDPKTAQSIMALLRRINRETGITIIVVTHQMSVLRSICERAAILENGVIAADDSVDQLFLRQPRELQNLVGHSYGSIPSTGTTLKILLSDRDSQEPVVTQMAHSLNLDFLVLGGEMEHYRNNVLGSLLINVPDDRASDIKSYLNGRGIRWIVVEKDGEE